MISNISKLIKKEFQLEWRQKTAIATIFIYVLGTTFLIYLVFQGNINIPTWIALFWIISLFTTVNAVSKSFMKDANEQFYYLRNVASPVEIILSKIIYNAIFITFLSLVIYAVMVLFFNENIEGKSLFLLTVILGSIGFSNLFTLLSAITARTQNIVLLAILGFPIILPLLLYPSFCFRIFGAIEIFLLILGMHTIKDDIILKIQNANNEQLLAEVYRILQADEYVLSENEIQLLNEADASINKGDYFTQQQIENRTEKWLNDMK